MGRETLRLLHPHLIDRKFLCKALLLEAGGRPPFLGRGEALRKRGNYVFSI
ncbi:MAG: hypothetical protein RBR15_16390 [Sphaerochaeta sp.]|nr:hypothetical protein [Sphaerochaeta sp.]